MQNSCANLSYWFSQCQIWRVQISWRRYHFKKVRISRCEEFRLCEFDDTNRSQGWNSRIIGKVPLVSTATRLC
jgi:hypothetical protein